MRRSSEEERAQFTVAELLARYGEPAPANTGRRRRRAADEPGTPAQTAAPPITHPNRAPRRESTTPPSAPLLTPDGPSRQPNVNGRPARSWAPAVTTPPEAAPHPPVTPPVVARRAPLTGTAVTDGPITEQLPRYNPASTQPGTSPRRRPTSAQPVNAPPVSTQPVKVAQPAKVNEPAKINEPAKVNQPTKVTHQAKVDQPAKATEPTKITQSAKIDPPAQAQPVGAQAPAGLTAVRAVPEQDGTATTEVDTEDAESRSPMWEWAAMVSQVGLGVVGGATLWLICEWLWQRIPVVALVVALGLITGMVWVVRRVRRAEDLQTTVIAVLVGLFVTVSPAALLLVSR
jgi:hypothetical protein